MREPMDATALCPECGGPEQCGPCHCGGGRDYGEDGGAPRAVHLNLHFVTDYCSRCSADGVLTREVTS